MVPVHKPDFLSRLKAYVIGYRLQIYHVQFISNASCTNLKLSSEDRLIAATPSHLHKFSKIFRLFYITFYSLCIQYLYIFIYLYTYLYILHIYIYIYIYISYLYYEVQQDATFSKTLGSLGYFKVIY